MFTQMVAGEGTCRRGMRQGREEVEPWNWKHGVTEEQIKVRECIDEEARKLSIPTNRTFVGKPG